jgi:hypothetical protein
MKYDLNSPWFGFSNGSTGVDLGLSGSGGKKNVIMPIGGAGGEMGLAPLQLGPSEADKAKRQLAQGTGEALLKKGPLQDLALEGIDNVKESISPTTVATPADMDAGLANETVAQGGSAAGLAPLAGGAGQEAASSAAQEAGSAAATEAAQGAATEAAGSAASSAAGGAAGALGSAAPLVGGVATALQTGKVGAAAGQMAGAVVGQAMIPIPIVGGMIGSMVGKALGGALGFADGTTDVPESNSLSGDAVMRAIKQNAPKEEPKLSTLDRILQMATGNAGALGAAKGQLSNRGKNIDKAAGYADGTADVPSNSLSSDAVARAIAARRLQAQQAQPQQLSVLERILQMATGNVGMLGDAKSQLSGRGRQLDKAEGLVGGSMNVGMANPQAGIGTGGKNPQQAPPPNPVAQPAAQTPVQSPMGMTPAAQVQPKVTAYGSATAAQPTSGKNAATGMSASNPILKAAGIDWKAIAAAEAAKSAPAPTAYPKPAYDVEDRGY